VHIRNFLYLPEPFTAEQAQMQSLQCITFGFRGIAVCPVERECALMESSAAHLPLGLCKGERPGRTFEEESMNWDQVEGKWKEYSGKVKEKWGKLTDDDLTVISGKKEQLVGKLQQRYGMAKDQAEQQVDEFTRTLNTTGAPSDASKAHTSGR
jgi:uncharacterized protein YjbJ (UPF0337 family)